METVVLDSPASRARGVIGRYPREGEQYVLRYPSVERRGVHMLFVRRPLRVTWRVSGTTTFSTVLRPWTGQGWARCDEIVEERPDSYRE